MSGPEFQKVEAPLIAQLVRMGWKHTTGNLDHPSVTGRGSFREVLLLGELRAAITRINLRDGKPWLDDDRISQAVSELDRISKPKLMEANQAATQLLVKGCDVEGLPGWDGGRSQTIHYIDWEHPERNTFRAINQFRLDTPGRAKDFIAPDIVLFVNGILLVVIECKSPSVSEPMAEAIDQLRRYSNQRKASGEVEDNEGNERLFVTNQILVATSFDEARVGTIGADVEHYAPWRDAAPCSLDDVRKELGKAPSDALSLPARMRLLAEPLVPPRRAQPAAGTGDAAPLPEETVAQFCRRRLGARITAEAAGKFDLTPKHLNAVLIGLHQRTDVFRVQRQINAFGGEPLMAILPGLAMDELWQLVGSVERTLHGLAEARRLADADLEVLFLLAAEPPRKRRPGLQISDGLEALVSTDEARLFEYLFGAS